MAAAEHAAAERRSSGDEGCQSPCGVPTTALADLDPEQRLQALAALTARFSTSYLRWMGSRGEGSYPRVRLLDALAADGPTIMRDVAASLGMTARNVTAIVDALEEAGLVIRTRHPHDRRATLVQVTDAGRAEVDRARRAALGKVAGIFDALSPEEQQDYARLVSRLSERCCGR